MKRASRFLGAALTLYLVLGSFFIPAEALSLPFADVDEGDWYYDAVQYVYERQLMGGTDSAAFSPEETTSRGMIVTVLHRMEECPAAAEAGFVDIPAGQWYSAGANWAASAGVVGGYGDGRFGPEDGVTREQLAAILYRYCEYKRYDTGVPAAGLPFSDAAQISPYAVEAVAWAAAAGILSGMEDGSLAPRSSATRAEIATVLARFHQEVFLPVSSPSQAVRPEIAEPELPESPELPELPEPELPRGDVSELPAPPVISDGFGSTTAVQVESINILRNGESGGDVRPGDTLTASVAPAGAVCDVRWTASGRSADGGAYTVGPLDLGETVTVTAVGRDGGSAEACVTVANETRLRLEDIRGGAAPIAVAPEAEYYRGNTGTPVVLDETSQLLLTITPVQAEESEVIAAKEQLLGETGEMPAEIHAADVELFLVGTAGGMAERTQIHPVGGTVLTLSRAALGLPESADLHKYRFAASHTNFSKQRETAPGEVVSVDGGEYVRFSLNGLSRVYIGIYPLLTVTFDAGGGTPVPETQTVCYGGRIQAVEPPVREGWLFAGWDRGNEAVTGDMTVTARWAQCVQAPGGSISGSWENKTGAAAAPSNIEEARSDGVIALTLFEGATYLRDLFYRLELSPPEGAVKYASADSAEAAAAAVDYASLDAGNPSWAVAVTDSSDSGQNVLTEGGAHYVKWVDAAGEVLALHSVLLRIEIKEDGAGGDVDSAVPVQMKNLPVDRGLGRVSVRLTGGEVKDQTGVAHELPDYVGNIICEVETPGNSGADTVRLNLEVSFARVFGGQLNGGSRISSGDYDSLRLDIAPFQGEALDGTPEASVSYFDPKSLDTATLPAQVSLEEGGILLLLPRPEEAGWPDSADITVSLGEKTQRLRVSFRSDPSSQSAGREPQWNYTSNWAEALDALQAGKSVWYTGPHDVVLSNPLEMKSGQALQLDGATLTIAGRGCLSVSGAAAVCAEGICVEDGGKLQVPQSRRLELTGGLEVEPGGQVEIIGDLAIYPNYFSDIKNRIAGTVTVKDGRLDVYGALCVTDTGKVTTSGDYVWLSVTDGLLNEGTMSLTGCVIINGIVENRGTISFSGFRLELSDPSGPMRNTGTISVTGGLTISGATLVNTGTVSGTGRLEVQVQTAPSGYDTGIRMMEIDADSDESPGNYTHSCFVSDPPSAADVLYFAGTLSNEDGGTCTLTASGE